METVSDSAVSSAVQLIPAVVSDVLIHVGSSNALHLPPDSLGPGCG